MIIRLSMMLDGTAPRWPTYIWVCLLSITRNSSNRALQRYSHPLDPSTMGSQRLWLIVVPATILVAYCTWHRTAFEGSWLAGYVLLGARSIILPFVLIMLYPKSICLTRFIEKPSTRPPLCRCWYIIVLQISEISSLDRQRPIAFPRLRQCVHILDRRQAVRWDWRLISLFRYIMPWCGFCEN